MVSEQLKESLLLCWIYDAVKMTMKIRNGCHESSVISISSLELSCTRAATARLWRNKLRYSAREGAKRMIEQGAWKLTKLWAIGAVVRVCTMGCGGVGFGRQLGLTIFWGNSSLQIPKMKATVFSETLADLPTKLHDVILKKLAILIFIAVRISGHVSFLHRNRWWLRYEASAYLLA
jgi:hypothetical protein